MESPRTHQDLHLEPIINQHPNEQPLGIPVDCLQATKSSENPNTQDLRVSSELRINAVPDQEGTDLIEVSVPHKGSAEEVPQQSPKSSQESKIEVDNGSAGGPETESRKSARYQLKVNQSPEDSNGSNDKESNAAQGENSATCSSADRKGSLKLNVIPASEGVNEAGPKAESPPNGNRWKDRSPNLKLLIVTNQNIGGELNSSENGEGNAGEGGNLGVPNIKKSHSQNEISASEPNGDQKSESPGTMRKNASTSNLNAKEEENKAEPVSASPAKAKLSMEDFHKITSVGKGSYGEVFLVKKISNNKLYALKAIDKNFMKKEKKEHQVYVEREVLLKLNHPNIIRLYSSFQDKLKLYFVLEYVGGGEFSDYLRVQGKLTKDQIIFFSAEIINILEYLHTCGIAHRDMKPENLLLTPEGHLKCIDFGTAKFLATEKRSAELFVKNDSPTDGNGEAKPAPRRNHRSTFVGTAQYVSPEMLEGSDCGAAADLWAFGCMIYLMTTGQFPFADTNEYLIFQKIKAVSVNYPEDMDLEIKDLIQKLLVKDPEMRLGAGEKGSKHDYEGLRAHSLFRGVEFAKLHEQKPPLVEIASPHKRRSHDFEPAGLASNQQQRKHFHSDDLSKTENKETKTVEFPTDKAIRVILSGLVLKKTNWVFYRPRQLIMNSKPRLVYYDPDSNQLKGEIVLAPTTKAELESKTKFTITTPTKKFVFKEMEHSAEKWVEIINAAVQQLHGKK